MDTIVNNALFRAEAYIFVVIVTTYVPTQRRILRSVGGCQVPAPRGNEVILHPHGIHVKVDAIGTSAQVTAPDREAAELWIIDFDVVDIIPADTSSSATVQNNAIGYLFTDESRRYGNRILYPGIVF